MDKKVHRKIMRRVYMSFALSIAEHPMFWRGAFLGAAALLLMQWLHVASIINNFLATPLGNTPGFVANTFVGAATGGELMTVVTIVLAGVIAISCAWRFVQAFLKLGIEASAQTT